MIMLCMLASCTAQDVRFQSMDVAAFEAQISKSKVIRVDVRTEAEYRSGHLADAINIDVMREDFERQALATLPAKSTVAVYCRSGKRSKKAADILVRNGYTVVELSTGINGWTAAQKPLTNEEVDLFVTDKGTLIYSYCIKHGSLKFRVGDQWIYVDPVTKAVPPVTDYSTMPKADLIFITHNHQDHLDLGAIEQLRKEGTVIVSNALSGKQLKGSPVVMTNGQKKTIHGWGIEAVAAYNTSTGKQQFHPKGRDNGYVLTVDGFRIYIAGDTEVIPEMEKINDIDVAFLPCNLPFTMTPEQLAEAAKTIAPKVLFPYHYGKTDIQQVVTLLKDTPIDVRIRQYQ